MTNICKLTGTKGTFVKAHLLPRALTRPSRPGTPFIQSGEGHRPTQRWDSWYDKELVTREGEDILEVADTRGIMELRRLGLVWSGRAPNEAAPVPDYFDSDSGVGTRILHNIDTHAIRMFILSLLWRCAASAREEVKDITLRPRRLQQLRRMLLEDIHEPLTRFPFVLTQLTEVGETHNLAPLALEMPSIELNGKRSKPVPVYRFYINGLIANVIRKPSRAIPPFPFDAKGKMLLIMTQTTEKSFQIHNLRKAVVETYTQWPEHMSRLGKSRNG